ncbi:SDR family oxidoreductase [Paenarthrobacter nitroguajacolicus]|uniref:SDR family NAD(P)-dependent oxidoreductase n=1 Tax=Paenarthrobacter nitroguajacolicus TaxID=211146 RepID=UPI002855146E|nr:SDR family oxidoreductase [Paenarthrobacter nitroguajacolicus]MDR6637053.1 3-oxoacyl-[acyl-carrier protein] reductase [Paenarthrobacter nitroguajacolicus]
MTEMHLTVTTARATRQTAVVTGATRGLGAVIARTLHAHGYNVLASGSTIEPLRALVEELDPTGKTAAASVLDVRRKGDFEEALSTSVSKWGAAHVLVNNAGRSKVQSLMDIRPEDFGEIVSTNLDGVFFGCQVFGRYFSETGYGRIVNIGSLAGQNGGTATGAHYAAAKGGVATLTKVFARDLAAGGVTVNSVSPGPLDLPVVHESVPPEKLAAVMANIPVGQLGSAEFIASTVALLASPEAAFVNGASWDINGGLFMR